MIIWKKQLVLCILLSSTSLYASDQTKFECTSDEETQPHTHFMTSQYHVKQTRELPIHQDECSLDQRSLKDRIQEMLQSGKYGLPDATHSQLTYIQHPALLGAGGPPPGKSKIIKLKKYAELNRENIFRFAQKHQKTLFDTYWGLNFSEHRSLEEMIISSTDRIVSSLNEFFPLSNSLRRAPQQYVDRENVENPQRRSRTKSAVEVIFHQVKKQNLAEDELLEEVIAYIQSLQRSDRYASFTRDNKECVMNEVDNALRTINALKKTERDFGSILPGSHYLTLSDGTSMSIKGLLARTWWIITNRFQDNQREMLQESLVKALGQCIEDDGHRVCGNGKTQRIASVLQGYVEGIEVDEWKSLPAVEVFLKGLFAPINEELQKVCRSDDDEERQSYAQKFHDSAMQQARQTYGDSTEHLKEVQNHIIKFASLTLQVELEPQHLIERQTGSFLDRIVPLIFELNLPRLQIDLPFEITPINLNLDDYLQETTTDPENAEQSSGDGQS